MHQLKVSLIHGGILTANCSIVFIKHIEGYLSRPETAIDKKMGGRLASIYAEREKEDHIEIETKDQFPFPYLHIINFHKEDLPFSYSSVATYAHRIVDCATRNESITSVATTVHGPGAGLDASEALETMLEALAEKLHTDERLGNLQEILFIERDKVIFDRLQERMKHLASDKDLFLIERGDVFLKPGKVASRERLSLKPLFVAMPYKDEFENVYYYGIKKPIDDIGRQCERNDQEQFVGDVVDRIKKRIAEAELVIADITGNNPNVFYEVGFAEGIKKKVILISQEKEAPFDVRTQRQILYHPQKIRTLETQLRELMSKILLGDRE